MKKVAREQERRVAERREFLASPRGREQRERSKTAFRGLGDGEALGLLRREFSRELRPPVPDAAQLVGDDRVVRFVDDYRVVVGGSGGRPDRLIDSTLPLRVSGGGGLVDLDLEAEGGGFVAANGLVDVELPLDAADPIELGPIGVTVAGGGEAVKLDADTLAYANVGEDADMAVNLTPTGFETYHQLRSPGAPVVVRYELDLPEGGTLRRSDIGGAEIVQDGQVRVVISPPVAVDAQGQEVQASYRVSGGELAVVVRHRDAQVAHPVLLDPEFRAVDNYACSYGTGACEMSWFKGDSSALQRLGHWRWFQNTTAYSYGHFNDCSNYAWFNNCYGASHGGGSNWNLGGRDGRWSVGQTGLHAVVYPDQWYQGGWETAEWAYVTPSAPGDEGPRTTQIYRADFGAKFLRKRSSATYPVMYTGIYSYSDGNWVPGTVIHHNPGWIPEDGYGGYNHHWNAEFGTSRPGPQGAAFGFTNPSATYLSQYRDAYMGAAIIQLTDPEAPVISEADPTLSEGGASANPSKWTRNGIFTFAPRAKDAGLGVRRVRLSYTAPNGQTVTQERGVYCHGARDLPCEDNFKLPYLNQSAFTLNAADTSLPEGDVPITIRAADALGSGNDENGRPHETTITKTIKLDRTAPRVTGISGMSEGELLRDHDYTITASSTDGLSGSQSISIELDGVQKAGRTDCPATSAPCETSWTFDGGDPALAGGTRTIKVVTTDQAGNRDPNAATRTFRVDRTKPTYALDGSLLPIDTGWVARGRQDLIIDARDAPGAVAATGVTYIAAKIDGVPVQDPAERPCPEGGCQLSTEMVKDTDPLAQGSHTLTVLVRDGAGNSAGPVDIQFKLERTPPNLTVTGPLKALAGQPFAEGSSRSLNAYATDSSGGVPQAGLGKIDIEVDEDGPDSVDHPCPGGGCDMSRDYTFKSADYEPGPHKITVTATDMAGNETSEQFTINSFDPSPPACGVPPAPSMQLGGVPATEQAARTSFRSRLPELFQPWQGVTLLGSLLQPRLTLGANGITVDRSLTPTKISSDSSKRVRLQVETDLLPICMTPTGVGALAASPTEATSDATVLFANSAPSTDTAVRPTLTGVETFTQLRDLTAPREFTWQVDLQPGQILKKLPEGTVAVVVPLPGSPPSPVDPAVPPLPSIAEQRRAITDTRLHIAQSTATLERALQATGDDIVALIPKPWALDAAGKPVATSLEVSGSQLRMIVEHVSAQTSYPVVADPQVIVADSLDEWEARSADAETADYTYDQADTAPLTSQPSDPAPYQSPAPTDAVPDDGDQREQAGDVSATEGRYQIAEANAAGGRAHVPRIGLTESQPALFYSPDRTDLAPTYYRPVVPWNVRQLAAQAPGTEGRNRADLWESWYQITRAAGVRTPTEPETNPVIKSDIAIQFGPDLDHETARAPKVVQYKKRLNGFLNRYGDVVDSLSPWNEPDLGLNDGDTRFSPTRNYPKQAARYWIVAQQLCHPKDDPDTELVEQHRCRHVVAGEYAGQKGGTRYPVKYRDEAGRLRERKQNYARDYATYLFAKRHKPQVWAFHPYNDMYRYALRPNKNDAPTSEYYFDLLNGSGYGTPKIWITAVGSYYHRPCATFSEESQGEFCRAKEPDNSPMAIAKQDLLVGMERQKEGVRKLLRRIGTGRLGATDAAGARLARLYYHRLQLVKDASVFYGGPATVFGPGCCDRKDWGLVGAQNDNGYPGGPGVNKLPPPSGHPPESDWSKGHERRLAYCVLRAVSRERVLRNFVTPPPPAAGQPRQPGPCAR